MILLTGSKWNVGKLLSRSRVVVKVAVGVELHPLRPGVVQTVVDGRGDADLVAHRDGVACCSLRGGGDKRVNTHKLFAVVNCSIGRFLYRNIKKFKNYVENMVCSNAALIQLNECRVSVMQIPIQVNLPEESEPSSSWS